MFDFLTLKKSVDTIRERHAELVRQAQSLEREKSALAWGSASKDDIIRELDAWVDRQAAKGLPEVRDALKATFGNVSHTGGLATLADQSFGITQDPRNDATRPPSMDAVLCALFPQQVKAYLRQEVEALNWPNERPTLSKWAKLVDSKEQERMRLVGEITKLQEEARDAGIALSFNFMQ